jgi:hypothetical protein
MQSIVHPEMLRPDVRMGCAPCKGGAFKSVQAPPMLRQPNKHALSAVFPSPGASRTRMLPDCRAVVIQITWRALDSRRTTDPPASSRLWLSRVRRDQVESRGRMIEFFWSRAGIVCAFIVADVDCVSEGLFR